MVSLGGHDQFCGTSVAGKLVHLVWPKRFATQTLICLEQPSTFHQTWVRALLSLRTPLRFRLFAGARVCQVRAITLPRTSSGAGAVIPSLCRPRSVHPWSSRHPHLGEPVDLFVHQLQPLSASSWVFWCITRVCTFVWVALPLFGCPSEPLISPSGAH